jgi:hypothetical protein
MNSNENITPEEANRIERVVFDDDEKIRLRDGKIYSIIPISAKDARKFMKLLSLIHQDLIVANFMPTGDLVSDTQREAAFTDIMGLAFKHYPEHDMDYWMEYVDVVTAKDIIEIMVGLNGIKK